MTRQTGDQSTTESYAIASRLHRVTDLSVRQFAAIASSRGFTAPQARCLLRLDQPTRMNELSAHLGCDKSNVTGIAQRLTARGLITSRRGEDRRAKLLELTDRGREVRTALAQAVGEGALPMTTLTTAERRTLVALLDKLLAGDQPERTSASNESAVNSGWSSTSA